MKNMSSLDIYAITKELQGLIGYRVENIYRDLADKFFLLKIKGKGEYKNPFLLIEPGVRIHLTDFKHPVPERPSDKIMSLRSHLKGSEIRTINQVDFDRLIEITMDGKQEYRVYIELFGNHPNFVVVGNKNRIISALWYKKMRDRDLLPGKEFTLPPKRGKSILNMNYEELFEILKAKEVLDKEIVRILAQNTGGGGELIEELLARAEIVKNTKAEYITEKDIERIVQSIQEIKDDLRELKPCVILDSDNNLLTVHPITFKSITGKKREFKDFSKALDYYYTDLTPKSNVKTSPQDKMKKKVLKIQKAQQKAIEDFERKKIKYKKIGDIIYQNFENIDELLATIVQARKKNIGWEEIESKLIEAKEKGIASVQILEGISPETASVKLKLDSEIIEVDFRKSVTEIANEYYQLAKKASRKITPAKEALKVTEKKINYLDKQISEQEIEDAVLLKRRKRKWFEKYHWTISKNGYLIIGGKDIRSNEEIVKRRMAADDLFFHAELHGAPYTVLVHNSSNIPITNDDYNSAALLAASFSSGWKAGYAAVDVYYVGAESVSFSAPSGEYIPKGGIMVRGDRSYIKGVELNLAIGVQIHEANATVIYGAEETIRHKSTITVIIKPGSISKGKIAKKIQQIFLEKIPSLEDKAKIRGIDLNEFVHAIPNNSVIIEVEYREKTEGIESYR